MIQHRLSWEGILVQKTEVINRQQPEAFSWIYIGKYSEIVKVYLLFRIHNWLKLNCSALPWQLPIILMLTTNQRALFWPVIRNVKKIDQPIRKQCFEIWIDFFLCADMTSKESFKQDTSLARDFSIKCTKILIHKTRQIFGTYQRRLGQY